MKYPDRFPRAVVAYPNGGASGGYIEFELDPDTMREIEELARESNCTPFEMCVTLLREWLASSGDQ